MVYVDKSKLIGPRQGQVFKKGHVPRRKICEESISVSGSQGHDICWARTFGLQGCNELDTPVRKQELIMCFRKSASVLANRTVISDADTMQLQAVEIALVNR